MEVKRICCYCGGLRFGSQHPRGGSQPLIIPIPEDLTPSSNLHGHWAHKWCTNIHAGKTLSLTHTYTQESKIPCWNCVHGVSWVSGQINPMLMLYIEDVWVKEGVWCPVVAETFKDPLASRGEVVHPGTALGTYTD